VVTRTRALIDAALLSVRAGADPQSAWDRAATTVPCAPSAKATAYAIYLALVTRPETR
jgi:hypothetical protein